ncbi:MAG: GNAT family N-acetyltransferase [Candidatus Lokiarchaeota archaeon]|nr:GNAT family N-acetyltransferase [Candidatus Lokiarchaeota archaeon]
MDINNNLITIRPAEIRDCKICVELSKIKELKPAGGSYIPEDYFKACIDDDEMFLVAEINSEVKGYILGEPMKGNNANLSLLAVEQKNRGQGIGTKLIQAFRKRCDEKNLGFIILYAPKLNKKTLKFYRKNGFEEGKEHIQFGEFRG